MSEELEKFQALLKDKIFQSDTADLDFGIYRILNYKRKQIEDFLSNQLPQVVEKSFEKHKGEIFARINQEYDNVKEEVIKTLGKEAFTAVGDLKDQFKNTPVGKKFIEIKKQKDSADKIEEIKNQVFNDLYNFFSRYYEEGDFIPQYRYSIKKHKYAIPYNGEEVKLYWANSEQYYIKTGLLFKDYTFKANEYKVHFRTIEAKEELGSNKATKERFFVLDDENPIEIKDEEIIIRFQYRELTDEEYDQYKERFKTEKSKEQDTDENKSKKREKKTVKQDKLNELILEKILTEISDKNFKTVLQREYKKDSEGSPISLLSYQLNRFAAKNTRDYFIHKNLKKFLSEQLDYFIKAEVLDIETLSEEKYLDKHITRAKTVKEIGEAIIDFLSQIEDFQKRLWEKKKFVIKTEYVITTDRIPEEFYDEIWGNKEQKKEWEELGFEIPSLASLRGTKSRSNLKLPVDTRYFSQEFKEKLLEKLTEEKDLDDLLDGLLIKSENWQALNLLLEKYKERVQTIFIDPPFNKEQDADYLYNVKYKDSTWVSMLENRLRLARDLLNERGSIFVRCDYNGNWLVRPLMNEIFGEENFRNEIIVNRFKKPSNTFTTTTESFFFYSKTQNLFFKSITGLRICTFCKQSIQPRWHPMSSSGDGGPSYILGKQFYPQKGRHWTYNQESIIRLEKEGRIRINENLSYIDNRGKKIKGVPEYLETEERVIDSNWTDLPGYKFGSEFSTENAEEPIKRVIESTSNERDLVMDFFLGSGTTTAVAQKLKRKWLGVEMGEHFYSVVLPRMKRVLAYDKSGISKEKDVKEKYNEKTAGGFFKYVILEQYEDALDNIELKENLSAQQLFKDEYLLKYFLDFETRESPYLLNIEHLKNPFAYKLKVNLSEVGEPQEMAIDIPETFNYLLGIKVKKIRKRENNGIPYLFILGEKESKDYAIVWREYSDNWDEEKFKEDRDFIRQELKDWRPQIVYVNGQSILTPDFRDFQVEIRYIEPEFKRLMEKL